MVWVDVIPLGTVREEGVGVTDTDKDGGGGGVVELTVREKVFC